MMLKSYKYEDDFNVYCSAPNKYKKKKNKLLFFSLLIFFFVIVISSSFLYFYMNVIINKPTFDNSGVFVNYVNNNKNITINNFNDFNSFEKSYKYSFYIENENLIDSNYNINIFSENVCVGNINYAIYIDDELVFRGIITDSNYSLYNGKLKALSNNNILVKLWSLSCEKYKFDINVNIGEN